MSTTAPARVQILFARQARTAVVIRRGPTKQVCTLLWNRHNDSFRLGQWLKGRIYEERRDISPDGKYFIYFAMNGRWKSETRGSWTAISQTPYLKAIGLWAKGDCWGGGGLFLDNRTYWLNSVKLHQELRTPWNLNRAESGPAWRIRYSRWNSEYYYRLVRDGWVLLESTRTKNKCRHVFERQLPNRWMLRKLCGPHGEKHQLLDVIDGRTIDFPEWTWADRDQSRLTWVEKGKLYGGRINRQGLYNVSELYDFNPLVFEEIVAPY